MEELEARVLYSADGVGAPVPADDASLSGSGFDNASFSSLIQSAIQSKETGLFEPPLVADTGLHATLSAASPSVSKELVVIDSRVQE